MAERVFVEDGSGNRVPTDRTRFTIEKNIRFADATPRDCGPIGPWDEGQFMHYLAPIDGQGDAVEIEQIEVRLAPGMDQLQIVVKDVRALPKGKSYIGWMYAKSPGSNITLAVVQLVKP